MLAFYKFWAPIWIAVQVVGIRACKDTVSEFLECKIAAHFMANRIVAPIVDLPAESDCRQDVHEVLGVMLNLSLGALYTQSDLDLVFFTRVGQANAYSY